MRVTAHKLNILLSKGQIPLGPVPRNFLVTSWRHRPTSS